MSTEFVPAHNVNAILKCTAEFSFAENATTAAMAGGVGYGYRDIGNVDKSTVKLEVEKREIKGSYRGIRKTDKHLVTQEKMSFDLDSHELNAHNLSILFGGSATTGFTQSAQTAQSADALVFSSGSPSDSSKWYDIRLSGARLRSLTTVTISTLTEGTDFEVDKKLGRIRFLTQQTASRTPVVTCPAITAADATAFTAFVPMENTSRNGIGRLTFYDENNDNRVALDYVDFKCEILAEANLEFDPESEANIKITVTVLDEPGIMYLRKVLT